MENFSNTDLQQTREQLIKKLKKIEPMMLRGSLIERYSKCGKLNCRCVNGEKHGPKYYLSVSLPGIRPVMIYIPREQKSAVEKALTNYRTAQEIIEKISGINRELVARRILF